MGKFKKDKVCSKCKKRKPFDEFYNRKSCKDGKHNQCKKCVVTAQAAYNKTPAGQASLARQAARAKTPAVRASGRAKQLRRLYGMTIQERDTLLKKQGGRCAICERLLKEGKGTHVDHDHGTRKVRGILCNHCNRGLGCFDDSVKIMAKAIRYIKNS